MKSYNEELVEKVSRCAEAGALATGCTLKVSRYELPYDNLISNETMNDVFSEALYELSGIEIQPPKADTGSLDAGQVSHICPTIHPYFDITDGRYVAGHTRELAECTLSDYAKQQMRNTLSALALTAYRIMEDPQLYKKVKEEFENTPK
jgi:metal-dependent amidase/aminoacylase/carboxypeptidase family protein